MRNLLSMIGKLPTPVQAVIGFIGTVAIAGTALTVSVLVDDIETEEKYNFASTVDRAIIPDQYTVNMENQVFQPQLELVEEKPKEEKKPDPPKKKETFVPKDKKPEKSLPVKLMTQELNKSIEKQKTERKEIERKKQTTEIKEVEERDLLAEAIAEYNARARNFSDLEHGRLKAERSTSPLVRRTIRRKRNRNKQDKWKVKTDTNTYPTDLSRVITKEKFIKCITGNRVVSTLEGRLIVHVSEHVYGTQGNRILIPKGSKGSGYYTTVEKIGNERINFFIERFVIEETGQLIQFSDPAKAGDEQGTTGVTGELDRRYVEKFGMPLIFSLANNLANLGFSKAVQALEGSGTDAEESIANELFDAEWQRNQSATNTQIINEIIKQNINIQERITIPAATEIVVFLNRDIWFKPNLNGEVTTAVKLEPGWREKVQKPEVTKKP